MVIYTKSDKDILFELWNRVYRRNQKINTLEYKTKVMAIRQEDITISIKLNAEAIEQIETLNTWH